MCTNICRAPSATPSTGRRARSRLHTRRQLAAAHRAMNKLDSAVHSAEWLRRRADSSIRVDASSSSASSATSSVVDLSHGVRDGGARGELISITCSIGNETRCTGPPARLPHSLSLLLVHHQARACIHVCVCGENRNACLISGPSAKSCSMHADPTHGGRGIRHGGMSDCMRVCMCVKCIIWFPAAATEHRRAAAAAQVGAYQHRAAKRARAAAWSTF